VTLHLLAPERAVTALLLTWQEAADERCLNELCVELVPVIEKTARVTLARMRIYDSGAMDDTLSLVLDHLRRLPTANGGVGSFEAKQTDGDSGLAYVQWLTTRRAMDVARAIRRRRRHDADIADACPKEKFWVPKDREEPDHESWLHAAIVALDVRSQEVVEFLLKGLKQSEIAKELGVCEGTVSRIRARAIENLRLAAKETLADFDGRWQ
jgi:RNA polymerase sigma factor (sigma-70 family)